MNSNLEVTNPDWETVTDPNHDAWTWGTVWYQRNQGACNTVEGYIVTKGIPHNDPVDVVIECVTKQKTHQIPMHAATQVEKRPGGEPEQ